MTLAPGVVVAGRFRLNWVLGRGGMGSVWHATHLGLGTDCAVKFIEVAPAAMRDARVRFQREAQAAARLRSSNVVQLLDHGVWNGVPYIAMELLQGEDLAARFLRKKRLEPSELCRIVTQVCRALAKAHAEGIVHRDLKPGNIFIVRELDGEVVKVLDFGIAKDTTELAPGTQTGALLGTPHFMSPEQAQGGKVDARSDLWSLAVIAYIALTGKLPFRGAALGELFVKIIVAPLPVPSQHAPVPPGFDEWFARAASRDPDQRFQSAKEFAEALVFACGLTPQRDDPTPPLMMAPSAPPPADAARLALAHTTIDPILRTPGSTVSLRGPIRTIWLVLTTLLAATLLVAALIAVRVRRGEAPQAVQVSGPEALPSATLPSAPAAASSPTEPPPPAELLPAAETSARPPATSVSTSSPSPRPSSHGPARPRPRAQPLASAPTPAPTSTETPPPDPMGQRF